MGARVILVSGPVNLEPPNGAELFKVESAEDMYQAALAHFDEADVLIGTAASRITGRSIYMKKK